MAGCLCVWGVDVMRPSLVLGFTPRSGSHLVLVPAQEGRGEAER